MTPFESDLLKVLGSIDQSLRQLAGRELGDGNPKSPPSASRAASEDIPRPADLAP